MIKSKQTNFHKKKESVKELPPKHLAQTVMGKFYQICKRVNDPNIITLF